MALQDEVELDELVQGETGSVSSRLLRILGLVFLLLAAVCLLAWATAQDSSAASNQDRASPTVLWTLSPTWTLAPTEANTTLAQTGATTNWAYHHTGTNCHRELRVQCWVSIPLAW